MTKLIIVFAQFVLFAKFALAPQGLVQQLYHYKNEVSLLSMSSHCCLKNHGRCLAAVPHFDGLGPMMSSRVPPATMSRYMM